MCDPVNNATCSSLPDACCGKSGVCSYGPNECAPSVCAGNCYATEAEADRLDFAKSCKDASHIHLTFDDGPDPVYTPLLLDELKKRSIQATFFLLGDAITSYPDIVKRIAAEGHTIGTHTFTHTDITSSDAIVDSELRRTAWALNKVGMKIPTIIRPPNGNVDRAAITRVQNILGTAHIIVWTADSNDWNDALTLEQKTAQLTTTMTAGASIVLFHDARFSQFSSLLDAVIASTTGKTLVNLVTCLGVTSLGETKTTTVTPQELPYTLSFTSTSPLTLPAVGAAAITVAIAYSCPKTCTLYADLMTNGTWLGGSNLRYNVSAGEGTFQLPLSVFYTVTSAPTLVVEVYDADVSDVKANSISFPYGFVGFISAVSAVPAPSNASTTTSTPSLSGSNTNTNESVPLVSATGAQQDANNTSAASTTSSPSSPSLSNTSEAATSSPSSPSPSNSSVNAPSSLTLSSSNSSSQQSPVSSTSSSSPALSLSASSTNQSTKTPSSPSSSTSSSSHTNHTSASPSLSSVSVSGHTNKSSNSSASLSSTGLVLNPASSSSSSKAWVAAPIAGAVVLLGGLGAVFVCVVRRKRPTLEKEEEGDGSDKNLVEMENANVPVAV